jgi:hypothetical protein
MRTACDANNLEVFIKDIISASCLSLSIVKLLAPSRQFELLTEYYLQVVSRSMKHFDSFHMQQFRDCVFYPNSHHRILACAPPVPTSSSLTNNVLSTRHRQTSRNAKFRQISLRTEKSDSFIDSLPSYI